VSKTAPTLANRSFDKHELI